MSWSLKYHQRRWAKEHISYMEKLVNQVMNVRSRCAASGGGQSTLNCKVKKKKLVKASAWRTF